MFSFSVSSYAASAVTYRLADFEMSGDVPYSLGTTQIDGKTVTKLVYQSSSVQGQGEVRITAFTKLSNELKIGASYTLTYSVKNYYLSGITSCFLYLTDNLDDFNDAVELGSFTTEGMNLTDFYDYSIQFQYPNNFNGKQCYIVALIVANRGITGFYATDFVFTNNDQSEEKIDGILEWLSAVYHSIVGGEDSRGVQHDGLVQGIKNGLNSLGDRLVNTFNNLKISIENKIDAIKHWFNELGENIIEGIKGLFIPEDGYFEQKKSELEAFFSEHFGIVYTAGSLGVNVIRQFTSLKPPETAVLKVPAWQMTLPLENDKVITIVPAMDVNFKEHINSSGVLHTFYNFYRAFITVVLIFMVVNYARRKYNYVFGKDGEGVE